MTEAEWLGTTDLEAMLKHASKNCSNGKLCLFALACCRRVWHLLQWEGWGDTGQILEVLECAADGEASEDDLDEVNDLAEDLRAAAVCVARMAYDIAEGRPVAPTEDWQWAREIIARGIGYANAVSAAAGAAQAATEIPGAVEAPVSPGQDSVSYLLWCLAEEAADAVAWEKAELPHDLRCDKNDAVRAAERSWQCGILRQIVDHSEDWRIER